MSLRQRVTLTLPEDLVSQVKTLSRGNLSQFVTDVLQEHVRALRREELSQALEAGCKAEAETDLALSEEFRFSDWEVTERFTSL